MKTGGEEVIFIGDQNKLIGCGGNGVENNNPKVSFGGKLVLELIAGGEYFLVNSSENVMEDPSQEKNPTIQP